MITVVNARNLGTATFATRWIDCRAAQRVHIQWSSNNTSSPVGAVSIEESNDPVALAEFLDNQVAETTSSAAVKVDVSADTTRVTDIGTGFTVNAANSTVFTVLNPAAFIRVKYTWASGGATATANCWAHVVPQ